MKHFVPAPYHEILASDPGKILEILTQPASATEFLAVAVAHDLLGRKALAESSFKRALQLDLAHIPSLYGLSLKAFDRNRVLQAKQYFERAVRMDPQATQNAVWFQKELKVSLSSYKEACNSGVWCLRILEKVKKDTDESSFQLGKILFEQSEFEESASYLKRVLKNKDLSNEATEYLSYIYERLYTGDDLIDRSLDLAEEVNNKSDLFFNLGMVCQHDTRNLELALHFFYLSSREDPLDPGLKFSLEQTALELIMTAQREGAESEQDRFRLMLAHLYQGSMGVARKYAESLTGWTYPQSFENLQPQKLWKRWLAVDEGVLGQALKQWFGGASQSQTGRGGDFQL